MMNTSQTYTILIALLLVGVASGCDVFGSDDDVLTDDVRLFPVEIDRSWGYINAEGRVILEPFYDDAEPFSEGLAAVRFRGQWGYIDESGAFVIRPQYQGAEPFSEGKAVVKFDNRRGYIDRTGAFVINPQFTAAFPFSEERAYIRTDSYDWEYIDPSGTIIRTLQTPHLHETDGADFAEGLALFHSDDDLFGYLDRAANPAIPAQYENARPFAEGLAAVKISDRWGFINTNQDVVITPQFIAAGDFQDGLAPVRSNSNFWGYVNSSGTLVIDERFEEARPFSDGRAAVMIDGQWGYIDTQGTVISESSFGAAEDFYGGLGRVRLDVGDDQRYGYVDRTGTYVWFPSD